MHNRGYLRLLVLIGSVLLAHVGSAMPAQAQNTNRCFPETGYCIGGAIRTYWEQNGGLAVFGLPLGPQQEVIDDAGVRRQAQWFERHRLELHPDKAAPYNVQLGRLGADRLAQQGRDWWNFPRANPNDGNVANCRFFSETSHTVCGPFLEAFRRYGLNFPNTPGVTYAESLALFGLPLSQPMVEIIDGKEYTVQWFERARFELHPENQPPQNVLFGRLGAELNGGRVGNAAALQGKTWELVSYGPLNGTQTAVEGQATLTFNGQQVAGTTGCNNFSGSYSATESAITFGQLVTTLRGCSESLARQETAVLVALSGERPYTINGELLRIVYDDGRQALNYRVAAQNVTALRQNRWELVSYGPTNGIQTAAVGGAQLAFEAERLNGFTGCNNFGGPYTANDSAINFGVIVSTLAACADENITRQERAILTALQGVQTYTIGGGQLRIIYDNGQQALNYRAIGP